MNVIKGFALNRNFVNNAPGVVADIGELSSLGFTCAKEPRVYSSQTYPTISLVHFPSKNSGVGTSAPIPDNQKDHVLKVISKVYEKSLSNTSVMAPGEFVQYLLDQLGSEIADVTAGGTVVSGNRSIVEWVQWRNPAVTESNVNKVWFSNAALLGQFDEFEHVVIPPFTPVNQFFGQPADVKALLTGLSYAEEIEKIDTARDGTSETVLWGNTYNYVNPVNQNDKTPAKFTVLIYGPAGNNIDLIKEAIVDYLLDNSNYTRDQWKNILPDLFLRTEFLIFPQWNQMAIENVVGGNNGVYSPVINMTDAMDDLVNDSYGYTEGYVRSNGQCMAFPYMSIGLTTIGNVENRDNKKKITDWFPDYFFTNNTSPDFNRMSLLTQHWVLMIAAMLPIARDMTSASTVPIGYSRVFRGNKMYLAKSYDNVQYLVAAPGSTFVPMPT